jgi:transglutaminase-like putative cysteine protease
VLRLGLVHETVYRYRRPVAFGRHRLVLRPREGHDLLLERMTLAIRPEPRVTWIRDAFGNSIALADFETPADELVFSNTLALTRIDPFPTTDVHRPFNVAWPPAYDGYDQPLTDGYRRISFEADAAAVADWTARVFEPDPDDAEGSLLALCEAVHGAIRYRQRSERGTQSPEATLEAGSGSCRDSATLLMEAARHLGVAARFASGYLHGTASLAGHAAMHAWTELYLPGLGWRGFDATTGTAVGPQHVPTGVSHHPRGVMPIQGSHGGTREDFVSMTAQVTTQVRAADADGYGAADAPADQVASNIGAGRPIA